MSQIEEYLLAELKAARRAIRAIKRETGKFDIARDFCIKADKRLTAAIKTGDVVLKQHEVQS